MKRLIYFIFILLPLSSCNDFLELEPETSLATPLVFDNVEGAEAVVNGIYSTIHSDWVERQYVFPELWTNNVTEIGSINNSNYQDALRHSVFTDFFGQGDYLWRLSYEALHLVNSAVVNLPNIPEENAAIADKKAHLEGEILFLRALIYFTLDRFWAHPDLGLSVPMPLEPVDVGSNFNRASIDEVHAQIISDLERAEVLLNGVESNDNRATIWSVKAFSARVHFFYENYSKAVDYANQVIESGRFSLTETALAAPYSTDISDENIFTFLSVSIDRAALNLNRLYSNSNNNQVQIGIGENMLSVLSQTPEDARFSELTQEVNNARLTKKYDVRDMNLPYLKLPEMYLIRGESRAMNSDLSGAISDLNIIKERAGTASFEDGNQAEIIAEFFSERTKEMAFEGGDNFFNLRRLERPIGGMDWAEARVRFSFFIPENETILNPDLRQNPVW